MKDWFDILFVQALEIYDRELGLLVQILFLSVGGIFWAEGLFEFLSFLPVVHVPGLGGGPESCHFMSLGLGCYQFSVHHVQN